MNAPTPTVPAIVRALGFDNWPDRAPSGQPFAWSDPAYVMDKLIAYLRAENHLNADGLTVAQLAERFAAEWCNDFTGEEARAVLRLIQLGKGEMRISLAHVPIRERLARRQPLPLDPATLAAAVAYFRANPEQSAVYVTYAGKCIADRELNAQCATRIGALVSISTDGFPIHVSRGHRDIAAQLSPVTP